MVRANKAVRPILQHVTDNARGPIDVEEDRYYAPEDDQVTNASFNETVIKDPAEFVTAG